MTGKTYNARELTPTRQEVGMVYKTIAQKPITADATLL